MPAQRERFVYLPEHASPVDNVDQVTFSTRPEPAASAEAYAPEWLEQHLREERHAAGVLSEIREAVFGAQDGLTSVLAVVSTVGGATGQPYAVLVAGLAATLAGIFSMAAGEYMSSKSQREIFEAQIAAEGREVDERPGEAEAEVAYLLEAEGLSFESAHRVASELAKNKRVLLKTMVEKELGLAVEEDANAVRGALVMGASFGLAALVPILPYLFLPIGDALRASVLFSGLMLFAMGALKSRWTGRSWVVSGLEIFVLGALAGIVGYFFGTLLPAALGVAGVAV